MPNHYTLYLCQSVSDAAPNPFFYLTAQPVYITLIASDIRGRAQRAPEDILRRVNNTVGAR